MNRSRMAAAVAVMTMCLFTAAAHAAVVVVDVASIDASGATYTGPGVLDTSSHTWELKPTTGNTFLLDGDTITMTYGTHAAGGVDATINLFDDYKHNGGGSAFGVVLTGLDMSATYNIVIYGAQNFLGGRGGSFDPVEPNLTAATTTGDQQSTFVQGVNYVRFDGWTPDNTLLDQRFRFLVGNGPDGIGIFNGFEIEKLVAVVPAPAALPAGLALLAAAVMRRRR